MISVLVSACADCLYPTELYEGYFLMENGTTTQIPLQFPFDSEWGACRLNHIPLDENTGIPLGFKATWLSIVEQKFYMTFLYFPILPMKQVWEQHTLDGESLFSHINFGMGAYGLYVLWYYGEKKSIIIAIDTADETSVEMQEFLPLTTNMSLSEYCNYQIGIHPKVKNNLLQNGLPPRDLFDNYMKQFTYRYQVILDHWDEDEEKWIKYDEEKDDVIPEFDYIEEMLYDGTHDKLHDDGLMKYHEAGKPKKLALKWHIKKSDYSAYFRFEEDEICAIFNKFYGQHPDTKTDFIIHIDPIKKKYELSLYRYGLKEPVIIPESAYQLIVFKSGFENYRSDNYNQSTGAWIW